MKKWPMKEMKDDNSENKLMKYQLMICWYDGQ